MIRDFLAHLHWSTLPLISMFLFMSVFFGVLAWVYRSGSIEVYKELEAIPLETEGEQPLV